MANLHNIQIQILEKLVTEKSRRFSELKPMNVESNHFMYHLSKLIKAGLITKQENLYTLSPKGERFVNRLQFPDLKTRIQPKIAILIACQNKQGEYLLYWRKRQPLIGLVGFPYAFINRGEKIKATAERELKEICGIQAKLAHRGDVYLTTYEHGELAAEVFCHIFAGKMVGGKIIEDSWIGKCFWGKPGGLKKDQYLPGYLDIAKMLQEKSKERFFAELTYRI